MKSHKYSYRRLIASRIIITAILLIIQFGWIAFSIIKLSEYSLFIDTVFKLLSVGMILYIIGKDDNPSYRICWIILMAALPLFGGLLYVFIGGKKPSKRLFNMMSKTEKRFKHVLEQDSFAAEDINSHDLRASEMMEYVRTSVGYPYYSSSANRYYPFGDDMFPEMLADIEKAEKFVYLEYFIIQEGEMWDKLSSLLVKKAESGVDVRIIYDDMGCVALLPPRYWKELEKLSPNIKCIAFNSVIPVVSLVMNNRDHRKILVIDGEIAYTGGINISDEYINVTHPYGKWKDTGVRITGRAVFSFTEMFLEMWDTFRNDNDDIEEYKRLSVSEEVPLTKGYIQPFSDTPLDEEPLGENIYIDIINRAKKYVYIFTPYLIIDDMMRSSLCLAAKRGVDVRIVTPGIPDKKIIYRLTRANYMSLLKAGVRIYEYTPGFIHAKSFISDDDVGVVGTINMDYRSLYLHFECGLLMYGVDILEDLKKDHIETMEQCREITAENYRKYYRGTMFDAILRVFAPLL
ncbi:MAG: cardiolipin synthase [Huintestinicola sp.]